METLKSLRVGEACWRVLRQTALDRGLTVRALVEGMVADATASAAPPVTRARPTAAVMQDVVRSEEAAREPGIDERAVCVCGVRLRDHQGGASKKLAVATNCRQFREGCDG